MPRHDPPNLWINLWAIPRTKLQTRRIADDLWKCSESRRLPKIGDIQPTRAVRLSFRTGEKLGSRFLLGRLGIAAAAKASQKIARAR